MFKSKSYNVKKISEKNEKGQTQSSFSSSTGTLKKSSSSSSSSGSMTLAKKEKIKSANNKESPEYSKKIYPKKTVTTWKKMKHFHLKIKPKKR